MRNALQKLIHDPIIIYALVSLSLAAATLFVFFGVTQSDFVICDDYLYVVKNINIMKGINSETLRWAFTTSYPPYWHPLTWISHMLDFKLFGLKAQWHHSVNLLLHIANTILVFLVLQRLTHSIWRSAFVAALFAIHPLHVESVAWVAERKDVLSTFFLMLTIAAYSYYVETLTFRRYLVVIFLFALALMSKPMVVTLPFVLLLLDFWPLRRLNFNGADSNRAFAAAPGRIALPFRARAIEGGSELFQRTWPMVSLITEKIPLLILAALSCMITYVTQEKAGAVIPFEAIPLTARLGNAFVYYYYYLSKAIWPSNLAFFYPLGPLSTQEVAWAFAIFIVITSVTIWYSKTLPYLMVGWLWFVGTLVPVIGIVQVGSQAIADRFAYVPAIGLFIMAAWLVPDLLRKWGHRNILSFLLSILILVCCCFLSSKYVRYWRNDFTLYTHAIQADSNNYFAYILRGAAFKSTGDYERAILDLNKAVELHPGRADAYLCRGNVLKAIGNYAPAMADYDKAIKIKPEYAQAYSDRGQLHAIIGDVDFAIADFNKSIELAPELSVAFRNRGVLYLRSGNLKSALEDFKKAASLGDADALDFARKIQ